MLAKIAPCTNDFHALAQYLVRGKSSAPNPKRVAWTIGHNMPTDDPELAAKLMTATAFLAPRTKKAAYHVMIAWHSREKPKPEVMQEIAVKTLELAGLGDHQALIMGHGDRPHDHLHIAINRVHPDTGKAWKTSHDYARFERIMEQLSEKHGFAYVPSHTYNPDLTDEHPKKPNSKATYAAKRGAKTDRPQWPQRHAREFGDRISEHLDAATTWEDLQDLFANHGLQLEPKGEGYVVGNDTSYTKLSSLGLVKTAHGFAKRAGGAHHAAARSSTTLTRYSPECDRRNILLDLAWHTYIEAHRAVRREEAIPDTVAAAENNLLSLMTRSQRVVFEMRAQDREQDEALREAITPVNGPPRFDSDAPTLSTPYIVTPPASSANKPGDIRPALNVPRIFDIRRSTDSLFEERRAAFEQLDYAHIFYRAGWLTREQLATAEASAYSTLDIDAQIERDRRRER